METISLLIGVLPLIIECAKIFQSIRELRADVRLGGTFQDECRQLMTRIYFLRNRCSQVSSPDNRTEQNLIPQSHDILVDSLKRLKKSLYSIRENTQKYLASTVLQRAWNYRAIKAGIEAAHLQLDRCDLAFVQIVLVDLSLSVRSPASQSEQLQRLQIAPAPDATITVQVRSIGSAVAAIEGFTLHHNATVGHLIPFVRRGTAGDGEPTIHLFKVFTCRDTFSTWTCVSKGERLSEIEKAANGRAWRIEYTKRSDCAIPSIHGDSIEEHAILIPIPTVPQAPLCHAVMSSLHLHEQAKTLEILKLWDKIEGKTVDETSVIENLQALQSLFHLVVRCT